MGVKLGIPFMAPQRNKKLFVLLQGIILAFEAILLNGCGSSPAPVSTPVAPTSTTAIVNGADVGWLAQLEGMGYSYVDQTGTAMSALQILKNQGVNTIRIRTFVNPSIVPGALGVGDNDQAGSLALAKTANAMGFQIMIDFHYSDTWADPGHQSIPAAWSTQTYAELQASVYNYTFQFMSALAAQGIYPQWVQVGNEIDSGMMWPMGSTANFSQLAGLINSGYNAVKAASSSAQVVVHLSTISDLSHFETLFDALVADGGKFDVIGASYYDGPGTIATVAANLKTLAARYGKPVMICEIGHSYSDATGAYNDVQTAIQAVRAVPNNQGLGVIYWEPEAPDDAATGDYSMGAVTEASGKVLQFTTALNAF